MKKPAPQKKANISESRASSTIFGYKSNRHESKVILLGVPWEVTTSYGSGTSNGPKAISEASSQLDLFDVELGETYKVGYHLVPEDKFFKITNSKLKPLAKKIIKLSDKLALESEDGIPSEVLMKNKSIGPLLNKINLGCDSMVERVKRHTEQVLRENKIPGLIGGDHSTPLGAISAVCEKHQGDVGVLHIDAHADLRLAYQGFTHSHASIMRNVSLLKTRPKKLVQVAIRDFCREEFDFINQNQDFVTTHFDFHLKKSLHSGQSWRSICAEIIHPLPEKVYVSFDIDGLTAEYCPGTGTPVPGGITYDQAITLISVLGESKRKIVGFDLNEVAPSSKTEWDANVGARILFKMCGWAARSNGLA